MAEEKRPDSAMYRNFTGLGQGGVWIDFSEPQRYSIYTMEFEFDPKKSITNEQKHGISFTDAQVLWDDPDLLEIPARTEDELRFLVIGRLADKHWSGVITSRDGRIRIISVRRSRKEEVALYES